MFVSLSTKETMKSPKNLIVTKFMTLEKKRFRVLVEVNGLEQSATG